MGFCGGSTTQKTEIDPASGTEASLQDSIYTELLPMIGKSQGINIDVTKTSYTDDNKYKEMSSQRDRLQAEYDNLVSVASDRTNPNRQNAQERMQQINNKISSLDTQMSDFASKYVPTYDFKYEKADLPDLTSVKERFGENSKQYKDAIKAYDKQYGAGVGRLMANQAEINQLTFKNAKDAMSGKFTLTKESNDLVNKTYAPQLKAIDQIYSKINSVASQNKTDYDKVFNDGIDRLKSEITSTGMKVGEALDAIGAQIDTGKVELETALTNTIQARQKVIEAGINDYSNSVTKSIAATAAKLGRTPSDPEFMMQAQSQIVKEIKNAGLDLAALEAEQKLGIVAQANAEKSQLGYARASLASETGGKLENAEATRLQGLAQNQQDYGNTLLASEEAKGKNTLGVLDQKSAAKMGLAVDVPLQSIGIGTQSSSLAEALRSQSASNVSSVAGATSTEASKLQAERMAQPTTTTTQSYGLGNFVSDLGGIASGVASAYTGFSTANSFSNFLRNRTANKTVG